MESIAGKLILFLGGARSGKSALAEKLASEYADVAYIATADAIDDEMIERIAKHKKSRPSRWITYEVEGDLRGAFKRACSGADAIIIDCMTVYIGGRMHKTAGDHEIMEEIIEIIGDVSRSGKTVLIISNEVGMGVVPEYPVGRRYRDLLGAINQRIAEAADKVILTIAGIPLDIKALGVDEFSAFKRSN
ncbi:MAG: bifunctional adenosylcobinamide kinase/adenosylcobinamide-phosphate guanylyltransferase [Actinobacteria bacterium]|nr:bifunctional adenosylcobinamide kinase/adenosylcobinamide-phosphate guanylyltransferase [Actinomycetota bacterium]